LIIAGKVRERIITPAATAIHCNDVNNSSRLCCFLVRYLPITLSIITISPQYVFSMLLN
jgi:hypothetical protein